MTLPITMRIENLMADWYSKWTIYKGTSDQMTADYIRIRDNLPKRTPQYLKYAFMDGMHRVYTKFLYRDHLEFCYLIDGKLYSTYRKSERYYEKLGINVKELNDKPNGFYWTGTERPYYISEEKGENSHEIVSDQKNS